MKKPILILLSLLLTSFIFGQSFPIAVNDTATGQLGDTVVFNVIENDIHPDDLSMRIIQCNEIHTDSTISLFLDYEEYYNMTLYDTIKIIYLIADENNLIGDQSVGILNIVVVDNEYYNYLDINNIRAKIQASGLQFFPGPRQGNSTADRYEANVYEFPKGSGKQTFFNTSLWVGGYDESDNLRLAAERYRQVGLDYWTGPLSMENNDLRVSPETAIKWQKVWKLSTDQIEYHMNHFQDYNYFPIEEIATWPAHGDTDLNQSEYLAPFIDVDGDSIYNPMVGDYPLIRGDQCIYFIINDLRSHDETGGEKIGLEIHGMAYEFLSDEIEPMNNTLFLSYKVFNRSSENLNDCYIGLFSDFDLGFAYDDFVGCDVERGVCYGYNGLDIDGDGELEAYGENPPAQGIVVLGGPLLDNDDEDNPSGQCDEGINGVGFGDGIVDNERYGMSRFVYFNNNPGGPVGDPIDAPQYYNYLDGIWRDGTPVEYGGNGHVNSGAYGPAANFMFPGLSDPCNWGTNGEEPYGPEDWTEETAGNEPGDRRGLTVMGPFTFEEGTMERIDFAFVSAFPEDEKTSVEALMDYIDVVKGEYYEDPTYFGYQWLDVENNSFESGNNRIYVYPNPAENLITFSCLGVDKTANYRILKITGELLLQGKVNSNESIDVDISAWTSGIYILTITDNQNVYTSKILKK